MTIHGEQSAERTPQLDEAHQSEEAALVACPEAGVALMEELMKGLQNGR